MKYLSRILTVMIVLVLFSLVSAVEKIAPKLGEPPLKSVSYIYIDDKTPDYIIKTAAERKINFAFYLKSSSAGWLRKNINLIVTGSPIVFIEGSLSDLERKYLDELSKLSDYNLKIICFSEKCEKNEEWKHPLIKSSYILSWKKEGKKENLFLTGANLISQGELFSVLDSKDFKIDPVVSGAVFFEKHGMAFVSIDEIEKLNWIKNAWVVIYYSKSEKKLKEFVEKKI